MGTISQFADKARPPAHRIESEEEALSIAKDLAAQLAEGASERDLERVLPYEELDRLAQSGLLAISIPSEHDGIDVSNAVLAEVTAILAEADSSIGLIPQEHFYILEALRQHGSEEQKQFFFGRALAGDRFCCALSETETSAGGHYETRITEDGAGYRINGRKEHSTGVLFADWIAVFALDAAGRVALSIVPRGAEGIQIIDDWDSFGQRVTGTGTAVLQNVYVNADSVIRHHWGFERPTAIDAVGQIIHASVDLGIARAAFRETVHFVRYHARPSPGSGAEQASEDPLAITELGKIAIRLEAATALIEHAGRKVDAAQVDPTEEHAVAASLAVAAAKVVTSEVALEATNTLFELAGTAATRVALNLDRYWRNARTHTLHAPLRWKYHAVGNYHVNGTKPPRNGAL
ncbi:SfnB family sulfur acquisition oxidoreductase [Bradyrhizobium sp. BRP14]|nr:SfnB family sulfur acquisition oxidoreductase [Bradyrhizobium sp. BRP14]